LGIVTKDLYLNQRQKVAET